MNYKLFCLLSYALVWPVFTMAQTTKLVGHVRGLPDSLQQLELTLDSYALLSSLERKTVTLDGEGRFSVDLELSAPTRAFISLGRVPVVESYTIRTLDGRDSSMQVTTNDSRLVYFYLQPGDEQEFRVQADQIPQTLVFAGKGANNSLYLNRDSWAFEAYKDKYLKNYYYNTNYPPQAFKEEIARRGRDRMAFLEEFHSSHPLDSHLLHVAGRDIRNESITAQLYYPSRRAMYLKLDSVSLPEDYYDFLADVSYQDPAPHKGIAYFYFLDAYLRELHKQEGSELAYYDFVRKRLEGRQYYEFIAFKLGSDFRAELYNQFNKRNPHRDLVAQVKAKYEHLEGMLKGRKAPKLTLTAANGSKVGLNRFKGQLVYIDLWATWCGPCIEEIPHLQKLEKDYADQSVVFLSLSMDQDKDLEKWRKFLVDFPLHGHQYWLDKANRELISTSFNVKQIPRFILLDSKLRVLDANAPRPSSAEIRKLLDKELK